MVIINTEALLKATSALVLFSGNTEKVYIGIGHSLKVAEWLNKEGFIILGFEGFRCDGNSIMPIVDYIADFSSIAGPKEERIQNSLFATKSVLEQWGNAVEFIEFEIEDSAQ